MNESNRSYENENENGNDDGGGDHVPDVIVVCF